MIFSCDILLLCKPLLQQYKLREWHFPTQGFPATASNNLSKAEYCLS